MAYDLSGILTGGAASRSDSLSGLDPQFRAVIEAMMAAAPPDIARELRIKSAYRSREVQAQLFKDAVRRYGSEQAARHWVAPPGKSNHEGRAIDWQYLSPKAGEWARANASRFGGAFPLGHEPWHMELAGARGAPNTQTPVAGDNGVTLNSAPAFAATSTPAVGEKSTSPLATIASALGGQPVQTAPLIPSSIGREDPNQGQGAAELLASLLDRNRSRYGLSLSGMV
jgi:hypothetical protein